jgi:hypothetical protein
MAFYCYWLVMPRFMILATTTARPFQAQLLPFLCFAVFKLLFFGNFKSVAIYSGGLVLAGGVGRVETNGGSLYLNFDGHYPFLLNVPLLLCQVDRSFLFVRIAPSEDVDALS